LNAGLFYESGEIKPYIRDLQIDCNMGYIDIDPNDMTAPPPAPASATTATITGPPTLTPQVDSVPTATPTTPMETAAPTPTTPMDATETASPTLSETAAPTPTTPMDATETAAPTFYVTAAPTFEKVSSTSNPTRLPTPMPSKISNATTEEPTANFVVVERSSESPEQPATLTTTNPTFVPTTAPTRQYPVLPTTENPTFYPVEKSAAPTEMPTTEQPPANTENPTIAITDITSQNFVAGQIIISQATAIAPSFAVLIIAVVTVVACSVLV